jgi:Icc-related predicted phosphoesterase
MNVIEQPIMVVSDLHYEKTYHHGIWEGDALDWLLRMIRSRKPSTLIALGDLGHAWTMNDWKELTEAVPAHAIYGNHDNMEVLRTAKNRDATKVLAEDGEVRTIGGLRVGFINGIMAKKGKLKVKDGVTRLSGDDFLNAAMKMKGIDILATHASPNLPEYGDRYSPTPEFEILDEIIRDVSPSLAVSGHLKGPYTLSKLGSTTVLRIDSSPKERHYALVESETRRIEIMHDHELVGTGDFVTRP